MSPDDAAVFAIRLAIITVGFVGVAVNLLQRQLSPVYGVSSFMFLAFVASQLVCAVETLWPSLPNAAHHGIHMLSYVAAFLLLPTFFIHLKLLSGTPEPIRRSHLAVHLCLPAMVFALAVISLFIPGDTVAALTIGQPAPEASPWMEITVKTLLWLEFGGYFFLLVYIWLLFRWQRRNRARIRTVFANGKDYEPFWTFGLTTIMTLLVAQALVSYFIRGGGLGHPVGPIEYSLISLLFILMVAIRGLRQAPGLYRSQDGCLNVPHREPPKYSKSALAAEHADRIARKLNAAMSDAFLYRDANLSLTKLAQHVGSSPNYVSQTLNEHMEQSFFDFVNHWRIQEAERLPLNGDDTILAIAYEVGFNSRSAFYSAFRKHSGVKPSEYRARHRATRHRRLELRTLDQAARP